MIQIRCKVCKRLAMEVSEDAICTIRTRCQRSSCKRLFTVTLPHARGCSKQRCGHDAEQGRTRCSDAPEPRETSAPVSHTDYSLEM